MGVLEIVLLLAGGVLAVLSFVLPVEQEEVQEDTKKLAQEEIKTLVERQMNDIRQHVDDVVGEAVTYAVEKTERSLERLSNEKIMAVNEYSDTVLGEIHKNHEETVFLYDMLNSKHNNLKNTVNELNKTIQEAKEVKREAEAVVSSLEQMEAQKQMEAQRSRSSESVNGAVFQSLADVGRLPMGIETIVQPAQGVPVEKVMQPMQGVPMEKVMQPVQGVPLEKVMQPVQNVPLEKVMQPMQNAPVETIAQAVRSIPLETIVQPVRSAPMEKVMQPVQSAPVETIVPPVQSVSPETIIHPIQSIPMEAIVQPVQSVPVAPGAPSVQNAGAIQKGMPAKGTGIPKQPEQIGNGPQSPVLAGAVMDLQFMAGEGTGNNNKEQILKLYQQGKSKVAIAKELGLGVGEVKLVIDLYKSL